MFGESSAGQLSGDLCFALCVPEPGKPGRSACTPMVHPESMLTQMRVLPSPRLAEVGLQAGQPVSFYLAQFVCLQLNCDGTRCSGLHCYV